MSFSLPEMALCVFLPPGLQSEGSVRSCSELEKNQGALCRLFSPSPFTESQKLPLVRTEVLLCPHWRHSEITALCAFP